MNVVCCSRDWRFKALESYALLTALRGPPLPIDVTCVASGRSQYLRHVKVDYINPACDRWSRDKSRPVGFAQIYHLDDKYEYVKYS